MTDYKRKKVFEITCHCSTSYLNVRIYRTDQLHNVVSMAGDSHVGNAAFLFDRQNKFLEDAMKTVAKRFDGEVWNSVGM